MFRVHHWHEIYPMLTFGCAECAVFFSSDTWWLHNSFLFLGHFKSFETKIQFRKVNMKSNLGCSRELAVCGSKLPELLARKVGTLTP